MFIELTDHLRCPAAHEEHFVVLLPTEMDGRQVVTGDLGCPVCGCTYRVEAGALHAGKPPAPPGAATALDVDAQVALLGVSGPGGYLVLVGGATVTAAALAERLDGVAMVCVNPAGDGDQHPLSSVIWSHRIPLRQASVRGVVLGPGFGGDAYWIEEAARVVLPGNRVVGEGDDPPAALLELAASADGCWVGFRETTRV